MYYVLFNIMGNTILNWKNLKLKQSISTEWVVLCSRKSRLFSLLLQEEEKNGKIVFPIYWALLFFPISSLNMNSVTQTVLIATLLGCLHCPFPCRTCLHLCPDGDEQSTGHTLVLCSCFAVNHPLCCLASHS